jgi:hypothetical protein
VALNKDERILEMLLDAYDIAINALTRLEDRRQINSKTSRFQRVIE